jgi:hypothetical protein
LLTTASAALRHNPRDTCIETPTEQASEQRRFRCLAGQARLDAFPRQPCAFGLTFGAVAVAVALSFGLGGREAAGRQMEYWLSRLRKND